MLADLRQERGQIEEAIMVMERLALGHGTRRGTPFTREAAVAPELDGIDATETGSTVWAFSRQTRTLYRIANAVQPAVTGTVVLRSAPVAIALSGQSIWVATQDGNLTELRQ